uniref:Uncharacterized protein n=1 Tax=Panagrolaimus sp. PS1159 TaxID=55785 RepID=A0AC35GFN6_9BILA
QDEYGLDLYGRGKFHSGLSPEEIPTLIDHFTSHFEQGIVFKTRFSILYICVPFDIRVTVDWEVYRRQYLNLETCDQRMFGDLKSIETSIHKHQAENSQASTAEMRLYTALLYLKLETCDQRMFGDLKSIETSIHKHQAENSQASTAEMRLYTALLVYRLCKLGMNSLYDCARTFKVAVGWIQQTYESMCHRAQALGRFSEHVNVMWPLKGLLPDLVNYMRSAGDEQIAQLMSVDGITRSMAHTLVKTTQFNTIGAIAKTTIPQLREALNGKLRKNLAERIIFSAKCVLRDAIDERKEEIAAMGGLLDEKIDDKLIE